MANIRKTTQNNIDAQPVSGLSSDDLAALLVDALLRARIIEAQDVERAVKIVVEELEVRKSLGDY